jgi:hypothetical protein
LGAAYQRTLDRQLLSLLDWQVGFGHHRVPAALTDSVIAAAVAQLPPETAGAHFAWASRLPTSCPRGLRTYRPINQEAAFFGSLAPTPSP